MPVTPDLTYVLILCALLYVVAVRGGVSCVEKYLLNPSPRRRARFRDTVFCSGDLLLWSTHSNAWYADLAKLICASPYTHVSVVFVDAAGVAFVWETNQDVGHRVKRLAAVLAETHHSTCILRKLNRPVDSSRMEQFIRANLGNHYSFNVYSGVLMQWFTRLKLPAVTSLDLTAATPATPAPHVSPPPPPPPPARPRPRRFCSQLVADTYECLGVISLRFSDKTHASLVLPSDFANPADRSVFHWLSSYALGPEIRLVYHDHARVAPVSP